MRRSCIALIVLGCLMAIGPTLSHARDNGIKGYGALAGLSLGPDQLLIGGFVDFGAIATPIRVLGFADVGFGEDLTTVGAGPSFVAVIPVEGVGQFYGGIFVGLNYIRWSDIAGVNISGSDTDFGIAADFGLIYPMENNGLLFDLKINLDSHADLKLVVGYEIGLD